MPFSHLVGFDDAPFTVDSVETVAVVGAVFAGERLDGVLSTRVTRDGSDSTDALIELLARTRFRPQLQAVLLQGIAFAGFNVIDLERLADSSGLPVLAVTRHAPDLPAIRRALLERVPGGAEKWRLIEQAGPMEPMAGLWVQRVGIGRADADTLIARSARHGRLPEPLRTAHLIAGGVVRGESTHRA